MQRCESGMWVGIQSGGPATGHWALSLRARHEVLAPVGVL